MTHADINDALRRLVDGFQDRDGIWSLQYGDLPIHIVTDPEADRVRVFAPVATDELNSATYLFRLLRANFETALDARYCIWRGTLYAAFMHPLGALDEPTFVDGIEQVVTLVKNTGESFASTGLRFGGNAGH